MARRRANCACSAATPAPTSISRRARSARLRLAQGQRVQGQRQGKLYSYVIHHRPVPGFTPPYRIAVVELDEGPRMMSNIVDCPQTPERCELDMKLEVAFEKLDDKITLPCSVRRRVSTCAEIRLPSSAPPKPPKLGVIPNVSQIQLHADAALNAIADAG
jgi:hypothetical protein